MCAGMNHGAFQWRRSVLENSSVAEDLKWMGFVFGSSRVPFIQFRFFVSSRSAPVGFKVWADQVLDSDWSDFSSFPFKKYRVRFRFGRPTWSFGSDQILFLSLLLHTFGSDFADSSYNNIRSGYRSSTFRNIGQVQGQTGSLGPLARARFCQDKLTTVVK